MHDAVLRRAEGQAQAEFSHLKETRFRLDTDITEVRPILKPSQNECDPTPSRLFLANWGFLELSNRTKFQGVQSTQARPFNFLQNFKQLDTTSPREGFCIGILYFPKKCKDPYSITNGSQSYIQFIKQIGWEIDVGTHEGYLGGLESAITGDFASYYSDYGSEVIYHIATLMPNNIEPEQAHKKRFITSDNVLISWVEDLEDYEANNVLTGEQQFNIIIHPLSSGLYRIKTFKKNSSNATPTLGPLQNDMIISKHILSTTVRQTAINAAKIFKNPTQKQLTVRKMLIDEFTQRHQNCQPLHKFYASQFTQM